MKIKNLSMTLLFFSLLVTLGCSSEKTESGNSMPTNQPKKETKGVSAEKVCAIFEKSGMQGEYKAYTASSGSDYYTCTTSKLASMQRLIYHASGNQTTVNSITLSMTDLYKQGDNTAVLKLLVEQGGELSKAIANQPFSKEIETAIMESKSGEWKLGEATVKLEKKDSKINEYDLILTFTL